VPSSKLWFNYDAVSLLQLSLLPLILGVGMPSVTQAQSPGDRPKVVIDDVRLEGATHLPETVRQQLVVSLKHREYEEDSGWISDLENIVNRAEIEGWPDREKRRLFGIFSGRPVEADTPRIWIAACFGDHTSERGQTKEAR
jgi:hypothetical protein